VEGNLTQAVNSLRGRIQAACENAGLSTYQQIADALDESYASVRRYVGGFEDRIPSLPFIIKICERLSISPDWLLFGRGPMQHGEVDWARVSFRQVVIEYARRISMFADAVEAMGPNIPNQGNES